MLTREEIIEAYAWADVVVQLSEFEGLPLTILEAMRQGVVVISTDVGAVSEAVRDDHNGVLLPLDSATQGCMVALQRLSTDRAMLRRLSAQAAADMKGQDWEHSIKELLSVLSERTSGKEDEASNRST